MPKTVPFEAAIEPSAIPETISETGEQWAQLVPVGRIETQDRRGPYFLDNADAVIAMSKKIAKGREIAVDYDHAIDRAAANGGQAPAAGWIAELEARPDGIWGKVKWTARAQAMIRDREYRFLSPVVYHNPQKTIGAIARVSLTNNPNFTMKALNAAQKGNDMDYEELISGLRKALNLDDSADAEKILAEVKELTTSRNCADPSKFVPFDVFQQTVDELNRVNVGVSQSAAERLVERALEDGHLLPFMREWAVSLCAANKPAFDDFLGSVGNGVKWLFDDTRYSEIWKRKRQEEFGASAQSAQSTIHQTLGLSPEDVATYGVKESTKC